MEANVSNFTIPIRGEEIEVTHEVRADKDSASNWFSARIGGKYLRADTLDALRTKLMNETKRQAVKVEIPFTMMGRAFDTWGRPSSDLQMLAGVITGIHQSTHKPLVRWDHTGKSEQLDNSRSLYRPMDKETGDRLIALHAQQDQVAMQIREIEREYALSPHKAVEDAVNAATAQ